MTKYFLEPKEYGNEEVLSKKIRNQGTEKHNIKPYQSP